MTAAGLPNTFVPGRNLLFFTYAAALAYRRGIRTLVGGMCETDYSGYPDCRNDTLQTLAKAISLGMDAAFAIETPLMWIDKAGTWAMADKLGGAALVDLIVEHTHTCYTPDRTTRHAWGYGCGACPACELRAKGWDDEWQRRPRKSLTRAVDLAIAGDWDGAHKIVQEDEEDATSCWIHAVLHKIEGDAGNSRYWYRPRRPVLRGLPRRQGRARRHQGRADVLTRWQRNHQRRTCSASSKSNCSGPRCAARRSRSGACWPTTSSSSAARATPTTSSRSSRPCGKRSLIPRCASHWRSSQRAASRQEFSW